jgi:hypothetical protein
MSDKDNRHEYHKFADSAVRAREDEEGMGRLRMALFWAVIGPLACTAIRILKLEPPRAAVWGILATIPLSVLLLLLNYIRLPGRLKFSGSALTIVFGTLACAGATFALYNVFSLSSFLKAS